MKMALAAAGSLLTSVSTVFNNVAVRTIYPCTFDQVRHYAARAGTRLRKLKLAQQAKLAKARKVLKLMEQRKRILMNKVEPLSKFKKDDVLNGISPDNVWSFNYFQWPIYTVEEVLQAFQETFHPTQYNVKNPILYAFIELNMKAEKKGKFKKEFKSVRLLPNTFPILEDRTIMAFTNNMQLVEAATREGATIIGGKELIKKIQIGDISTRDYDYYLADMDIVNDLTLIRGVLDKNLPNLKQETLGANIVSLVRRYKKGVKYVVTPNHIYPEYGSCTVMIGTLDMTADEISENIRSIIEDLRQKKPKNPDSFVTRVQLQCPPSKESFKIDLDKYKPKTQPQQKATPMAAKEEEEDGPDTSSVIISNV